VKRKKAVSYAFYALFLLPLAVAGLVACQSSLIYHPRPYAANFREHLPPKVKPLNYKTSCGNQVAFYVEPENGKSPPDQLWVLFAGNGSVALDWLPVLNKVDNSAAGYLLVDYPGYGKCEGKSTPAAILAGSDGAFRALAADLHVETHDLDRNMNVLGHSLGAAAGLQFAVGRPVDRIVLVAPFTSMHEMARRVVGPHISKFLTHNYDNRARLQELAERPSPPAVTIVHGNQDRVIPVDMSKAIAAEFPGMITLEVITDGDHNIADAAVPYLM
jgi:uncharacterized protein